MTIAAAVLFTATPAQAATLPITAPTIALQTLQEPLGELKGRDMTIGLCSCVAYARTLIPELPRIKTPNDLTPNTNAYVGVAVLLDYNMAHIAVVQGVTATGVWITEANFRLCKRTERFILFTDPKLRGFWQPISPTSPLNPNS